MIHVFYEILTNPLREYNLFAEMNVPSRLQIFIFLSSGNLRSMSVIHNRNITASIRS